MNYMLCICEKNVSLECGWGNREEEEEGGGGY